MLTSIKYLKKLAIMIHIPVLLNEVLEYVPIKKGYTIVDCTFGAGGYSKAFLERGANVIAIDRDINVLPIAEQLQQKYLKNFCFINSSFGKIEELNIPTADAIVLDIGVSSMQIDQPMRGFSFNKNGPLDMRMSNNGITAAEVINNYSVEKLTKIFRIYGEENNAHMIAKMIAKKREIEKFTTTLQLSNAISELLPKRHFQKNHPATKTFQALRIYVNDELGELIKILFSAERLLKPGGHLAVITFHSLEDRIVKRFLANRSKAKSVSRYEPEIQNFMPSFCLAFKKAIIPSKEECDRNIRARSAKLRVGIRTTAEAFKDKDELFPFNKINNVRQ